MGSSLASATLNYPAQDAFDDLVYGYAARGFDGFGDFSMIVILYSQPADQPMR